MRFFKAIIKDLYKHRMGRIPEFSVNIVFGDTPYTNQNGVTFKTFLADDGRVVTYTPKKGVSCPVTDGSIGDFPVIRGVSKVPLAACKKCQHWRKVKGLPGGCCTKWAELSTRPDQQGEK